MNEHNTPSPIDHLTIVSGTEKEVMLKQALDIEIRKRAALEQKVIQFKQDCESLFNPDVIVEPENVSDHLHSPPALISVIVYRGVSSSREIVLYNVNLDNVPDSQSYKF